MAKRDPVPTAMQGHGGDAYGGMGSPWPRAGALSAAVKSSVSALGAEWAVPVKGSHHEKGRPRRPNTAQCRRQVLEQHPG